MSGYESTFSDSSFVDSKGLGSGLTGSNTWLVRNRHALIILGAAALLIGAIAVATFVAVGGFSRQTRNPTYELLPYAVLVYDPNSGVDASRAAA